MEIWIGMVEVKPFEESGHAERRHARFKEFRRNRILTILVALLATALILLPVVRDDNAKSNAPFST